MEIILAKSAGFCFGVKRAIECVYNKVKDGNIYTYGPIIHNKEVIKDLEKRGVQILNQINNIDNGEVIIRSHGVPPDIYNELNNQSVEYTDCTCPFVKKIHKIVEDNYKNKKRDIIIIGNREHPEVIGINGWADNNAIIINSCEQAENTVFKKDKKYTLVVQTTFQQEIFNQITNIINKNLDLIIYNTICNATNDRQKEALEISKIVDKMIVLGDKSSSNTQKLYEIDRKSVV